jgi:hypothetical protein
MSEPMHLVHIDVGGPAYLMPLGGKLRPFELHPYCGPSPCHAVTGEILEHIPTGFWDAWERWDKGGRQLDSDVCVLPDWCDRCKGSGDEIRHLGGKHYELVGQCLKCKGAGVMPTPE